MKAERTASRCFNVRFTFHTDDCVEEMWRKAQQTEDGRKNNDETEFYWQMNGWRSLRLKARSEIKIFNIFRYPFYTCCVVLDVLLCESGKGRNRSVYTFLRSNIDILDSYRKACRLLARRCSFSACELFQIFWISFLLLSLFFVMFKWQIFETP